MDKKRTVLLWVRGDIRLADNSALTYAAETGVVVPVYIWEDGKAESLPPGGAARWWLQQALVDLQAQFHKRGCKLILRRGDAARILPQLAKECRATDVAWGRVYDPETVARDEKLAARLRRQKLDVSIHDGYLLFAPETLRTKAGTVFKVFTPFSRACLAAKPPSKPLPPPQDLRGFSQPIKSDILKTWKLTPAKAQWPKGLADDWEPTEQAAHEQLHEFIQHNLNAYKTGRDRPDREGTSRLSPYLHHGLLSPRQIWHAIHQAMHKPGAGSPSAERYILEILWREFCNHLIVNFPTMLDKPLDRRFSKFPYRASAKELAAWQKGLTGYPIVDAGMRQLWNTGWMHNRVRMVVASFLIKHLLHSWREGMLWFWDTLVDADLGNNTANWQWVAGCGADAAPYFRIFNPTLQGRKFDPDGTYVRMYVPELAKLDARYIHEPSKAPPDALRKAGITLGKTYPLPIVDHSAARTRALLGLKRMRADKT